MSIIYVKGVRTRYRNCLEKEIENCAEMLDHDLVTENKDDEVQKINKCIKLLKTYSEKVENQCEKYIALLKEDETETMETIMNEDHNLCERAMKSCLELEELRDKLVGETKISFDQMQARNLQREMQNFISEQSHKQNEFIGNQSYHQQKFMKEQLSQHKETIEKLSKGNERVTSVKLPKLELKSFNGNKMKWPEFWDTFECTVHLNKQLSDTEKFSYLQGKLVGEAKHAVTGLALCNENYKIAVDLLKERFGQKQEIIDLHYRAMMSIVPAINKTEALRQFLDEMEKHLRSLQVMDENINQNMFVSMIKSKIPKDVLLHMEMQKGTDNEWTVSTLRERLRAYIIARERAEQDSKQEPQRNVDQRQGHNVTKDQEHKTNKFSMQKKEGFNVSRRQPISTESLFSGDRKANTNGYSDKCRYCANRHWSDECTLYKTIAERKKILNDSCYKCLKVGHKINECRQSKICVHCGEKDVHHRSLCPKIFNGKKQRVKNESANITEEIQTQITTVKEQEGVFVTSSEIVLMQTAQTRAKICGTKITKKVRILLDSGSQRTYVTEHLADQLGLVRGGVQEIKLVTFGSNKSKVIRTPSTKVDIKLKDGNYMTISANIVPDITGTLERKGVQLLQSKDIQSLLKSVDMADTVPTVSEYSTVDILIGNDFYLDILLSQRIEIRPGLYLISSKLGWILTGRTETNENDVNEIGMLIHTHGTKIVNSSCVTTVDKVVPKKPDLEDFWAMESIGIKDNPIISDDDKAMSTFRETLKFEDGRYSVTWPWKENTPDLPVNRGLALGRLRSTVKRMVDKPELMRQYDSVIKEQFEKGIIEKVSGDTETDGGVMHYLPHHAVITPHKTTTKLRLVYDASAKANNNSKSLNECLHRGPIMLHNLCGILIRFRTHNIAVVADIEKAFLQVRLQKNQRDATRFLWLKNAEIPATERGNIQEYRFCRVPFGIISSPFILGATIECHLDSYESELAEKIRNNIYVDNLITGTASEAEAIELYKKSKHIFKEASMNLREWSTNSNMVNTLIAEEDKSSATIISVLGHKWDTIKDTLSLNQPTKLSTTSHPTKRIILKVIASVFDPLGLFSPVIVRGKVLLQSLWSKHLDWDDVLEENDVKMWNSINEDLVKVPQVTSPRCIALHKNEHTKYRIVCFCDASKNAYAATVYLHQENKEKVRSDLIFSKSRLAPVKVLTIPRLELMSVLIGIRCIKFVIENLSLTIESVYVWSDSQCVLHWIASQTVKPIFVENRLKEIKGSGVTEFHYVPSSENPADIASRGVSVQQLKNNPQWWHGPDWLSQPISSWRTCNFNLEKERQNEESENVNITDENTNAFVVKETYANAPFEIEIENYSTVSKLLRVTAFALRFIRKIRKKQRIEHTVLTKEELDEAENMWVLHIQKKHFGDVIHAISKEKPNNLQRQLGIAKDKTGTLRCSGRMQNAALCENSREPIILPKNDRYTDLVIEKIHKTLLHSGVSQTLSGVRSRFWIVSGRATVRRVLAKCTVCRRHEGGAYQMPSMAPLPKQRVTQSAPFSKVGLDYLGPLYVKTADGKNNKIWVCLLTCLVTRAIHLEIMQNLSAEEFLMGLRRFIACRGKPDEIISDNAQQFKLAGETIGMVWRSIVRCKDVQSFASENSINWKFIVEYAPWMGGIYERLVGIVKRSLRKTIGRKLLTNVQMQTLIKEVEAVINTRPLVYVGDDIDSSITLTPAHFLSLNPKVGLPEIDDEDEFTPYESSSKRLIQVWKKGQKLLNQFWKLWRTEYLLSLRERTQSMLKTHRVQSHFVPNVGNVVLIKDDVPRCCWRMGRITTLMKSSDGQIRSAKVKLASGRVVGRPLNLLFPIEVSGTNDQDNGNYTPIAQHRLVRPKRKAAEMAKGSVKRYFNSTSNE